MKQLGLFEPEQYSYSYRSYSDWELESLDVEAVVPKSKPPPDPPPKTEKVFCNRTPDPLKAVTEYFPKGNAGGRHKYYRFSYRHGSKVKHVHIRGGNTTSPVARQRAEIVRSFVSSGKQGKWIEERIKIWS